MASVAHKPLSYFIICHYILEFLLNQATFTRTISFCAACKEEGLATLNTALGMPECLSEKGILKYVQID